MKISLGNTTEKRIVRDWSTQQKNIFNAIAEDSCSVCVEAVAGSGKTTTIIEGMNYIPKGKRAIFTAFNRAIADELGERVPPHIKTTTLHSLCMNVIKENRKFKLWKTKSKIILEDYFKECCPDDMELFYEVHGRVSYVISLLKANVLSEEISVDDMQCACSLAGITEDYVEDLAYIVWDRGKLPKYEDVIDFDDMLRVPLLEGMEFPKYDIVFVDEAQDLNLVQHEIVSSLVAKGGRVIAVGDSHQAIYQFRGANSDSLGLLSSKFKMKQLPLQYSYRCPHEIVTRAQIFNPAIMSGIDREGFVHDSCEEETMLRGVSKDDMIVCRYNAPLVRYAIRSVLYGHKPYIAGRDLVWLVANVAKKIYKDMGELSFQTLNIWLADACNSMADKNKIMALKDIVSIINIVVEEGATTPKSITRVLETLFPKDKPKDAITLCTIHKSKGLEAEDVYIVYPNALPAIRGEAEQQEENLHYVAITRAKRGLYYVRNDR